MDPGRRLVVLSALRWLPAGLIIPVLVLMLGARGLSLSQVGQVMAVYSVVTLVLEVPTGGLSDTWGRRPVVVLSALLQAIALLVLAVVATLPLVLLGGALLGAARALSSGPLEAWYVDAMQGRDRIEAGLAHGQVAESLALGVGAVVGGFLPRLWAGLPQAGPGVVQLSVPFLVAAAAAVLQAGAAGLLMSRIPGAGVSMGRTMTEAVGLARRDGAVRRLLLVSAALGVVLSGVELLAPPRFAVLIGDPARAATVFGVLTAVAFGAAAAGAASSTRFPGARTLVGMAAFLAMGLFALGLAVPALAAAAGAYLALYVAVGVQGPVLAALLHGRISSRVRATVMSLDSLALQAGAAVAGLGVGALAEGVGLLAGLGVVAVAAVLAAATLAADHRRSV